MHRLAASLLCAFVAFAALAAPAPLFKPKPLKVWVDGWDDPVVLIGDCRFAAHADKLTVTASAPDPKGVQKNATGQMLRPVVGDFDIEARVSIDTRYPSDATANRMLAGIRIEAVKGVALAATPLVMVQADYDRVHVWGILGVPGSWFAERGVTPGKPVRLRLTRRGDSLAAAYSLDGVEWKTKTQRPGVAVKLPARLKVGVIVESLGRGSGKAVFDRFELTPLK